MGLNNTPSAERIHIGIFGRRNAGKSSLINALTGQNLAIVSEVEGTTTDPVSKAMELLPLGPVVLIDTAGIDDTGELGMLRVKKSIQVLNKTDIAVLVAEAAAGLVKEDMELLDHIEKKGIPCVVVFNKIEQVSRDSDIWKLIEEKKNYIGVSAKSRENIHELKELLGTQLRDGKPEFPIVGDLIHPMDFVVLVVPIDSAAPKGRLILPQQQVIRDILEYHGVSIVIREHELVTTLKKLGNKVKLVITDSQAFEQVSAETPENILLTSFSILFARYKGHLKTLVQGVSAIDRLEDGDKVLVSEGCTHHRQCDDIGTVKLPKWLREYTGKELDFTFTSGTEFPEDLSSYRLIVHCGGCTLNPREMKYRIAWAGDSGVPITNYGLTIAYINGILKRSLEVFPDICSLLEGKNTGCVRRSKDERDII